MNKQLKKELELYFYSDASRADLPEVKKQTGSVLDLALEIVKDKGLYSTLENEILQACTSHELQGFLYGYDYCLLMTGYNGA